MTGTWRDRPSTYFKLSSKRQWEIDSAIGILDWDGKDMSEEEKEEFYKYFNIKRRKKNE